MATADTSTYCARYTVPHFMTGKPIFHLFWLRATDLADAREKVRQELDNQEAHHPMGGYTLLAVVPGKPCAETVRLAKTASK